MNPKIVLFSGEIVYFGAKKLILAEILHILCGGKLSQKITNIMYGALW